MTPLCCTNVPRFSFSHHRKCQQLTKSQSHVTPMYKSRIKTVFQQQPENVLFRKGGRRILLILGNSNFLIHSEVSGARTLWQTKLSLAPSPTRDFFFTQDALISLITFEPSLSIYFKTIHYVLLNWILLHVAS